MLQNRRYQEETVSEDAFAQIQEFEEQGQRGHKDMGPKGRSSEKARDGYFGKRTVFKRVSRVYDRTGRVLAGQNGQTQITRSNNQLAEIGCFPSAEMAQVKGFG